MVDKAFTRFENSEDEFNLTKVESNGRASFISTGQGVRGSFYIKDFEDGTYGIKVHGRGFDFIRTSPVVKVVDETETSVVFQTMGGVYKLEKVVK